MTHFSNSSTQKFLTTSPKTWQTFFSQFSRLDAVVAAIVVVVVVVVAALVVVVDVAAVVEVGIDI